ncbi:proline-rich receptor-like protein kinase PERK3 isoform X1 [Salvia splendens]|uniref:proline-rich receptor-like protein kinase PERK3 isoform X1 n=2 Tax=Salvia splendens TaxID=180675 RepID=UPI001C274DFB|nr:proline-rich receptor-like protein kinase PERK3 isoform X1 [Salvia splendens]
MLNILRIISPDILHIFHHFFRFTQKCFRLSIISYRETPSRILIVCDSTKDRSIHEFSKTIRQIRMCGGIVHPGDTIRVFGVLHRVLHPMGYFMGVAPENFLGTTHARAVEEEVSKKVDMYVSMLQYSAEQCEGDRVDIEVKITAGTPLRKAIINEVATSNATWVIFDRPLRKELRYYLKHIPCKAAIVLDNFSVKILINGYSNKEAEHFDNKQFYSLSKPVPLPPVSDSENEQLVNTMNYHRSMESSDLTSKEESIVSLSETWSGPKQEDSGNTRQIMEYYAPIISNQKRRPSRNRYSDVPVLCVTCGLKTELDAVRYNYPEIKLATNNFSPDNLLGEGGYGHVYKGELKDGQHIAAKVRKEASTQGFSEFHSEIFVLSFARHKNIVMLLGYCCKENLNILVYEYICNKSLEWHLFENTNHVLEWHKRHAIAIGTAKGLRFLHEECRGSPIIHRDMRPGNILLTCDFVPMLGDFGLAKWKTDEGENREIQTRILGTLGYLAPEYAENGIVSVRTDVYSYGVVLIQLISGRKAVDSKRADQQPSLRQWALPLIERLALHELVDPCLGETYNTYELYRMAKTAYLCLQTEPERRPSMAEVLHLLEGDIDHFSHLTGQFIPD